jgi:MFS family permease
MRWMSPSKLPRTVIRNLALLASAQGLQTIVIQIFTIHVPIAILLLGGSTTLAGLGTSLMWGGRLVTAYYVGGLMDRTGRMPVISAGMLISGVTAGLAGLATYHRILPLYLAMVLFFGIGRGMVDYARIAAGDMLPPDRRGVGTGLLLTGSMAGTLTATPLLYIVSAVVAGIESDLTISAHYTAIPFALAGLILSMTVRPDPLDIARNPGKFYPYPLLDPPKADGNVVRSLRSILNRRMIVAYSASALTTGVMVAFMSLGSLLLHIQHIHTTTISAVVTIHVLGMFAFSIPLGRAADRLGRIPVMTIGSLVCGMGAFLTSAGADIVTITTGMFLVGLGWSAATVSSVALISDETSPVERGKALGGNDTIIALASLTIPIAAAYILERMGALAMAIAGLAISIPPILLAITARNHKRAGPADLRL